MYRVIGIDPGLRLTGYGVLDATAGKLDMKLVEAGVIRLKASEPLEVRLVQLYADLQDLLAEFKPQCVAVEKLYSHYQHPRTAILMGHARGVILCCAKQHHAEVQNLPATEVKKAITGYGHASKEQMQQAIQSQFGLAEPPSPPDVADALGIALTHARRWALSSV